MDPQQMAQFINSVPAVGGPQQPQQPIIPAYPTAPEPPVFQPSSAPMFPMAPAQPAAPMMTQPPAPMMPFTPGAPTWPMTPQQPQQVQPGGTIFQQPGQMQPQPGQQQMPGVIPMPQLQVPGQQPQQGQDQMPDWAKQITDQIAALQNGKQDGQIKWDENNRPRTWEDFQQQIEKLATDKATALLTTQQQQQVQQQQQQAQAQQQANQAFDAVEQQLTQMGMLPAVANPGDANDPGKLARQELYAYAVAMGATDPQHLGPAAMTLYTMHQNGQYFDRTKNAIVTRNSAQPGAFAPIAGAGPMMAGGQPGGMAGGGTGPTVGQLANLPLSSLAQLGAQRLGLAG